MSIVNFKPSIPNFDFTLVRDGAALLCISYGFGGQLGQLETKSLFQLTYLALLPVSVLSALFLSESILECKNMMALILVSAVFIWWFE